MDYWEPILTYLVRLGSPPQVFDPTVALCSGGAAKAVGVFRADHLRNSRMTRKARVRSPDPFNDPICTSKQYFSPRMELWTGLMTVLESALRSRLPKALMGIETDSRDPWCL